ncbi:hypothetical protein Pr1d_11280 [Bythopirellula goksoeyrii]|uniref:Uncharacterized protein n=1 Tax=Bythopirellula goksoeyrii TaxID=1400387 RepID=A0A5B9Q4A8_9BACT|nr:hypothetical protein Pr1d_11280 [Bythopirellula goksoeyrii]
MGTDRIVRIETLAERFHGACADNLPMLLTIQVFAAYEHYLNAEDAESRRYAENPHKSSSAPRRSLRLIDIRMQPPAALGYPWSPNWKDIFRPTLSLSQYLLNKTQAMRRCFSFRIGFYTSSRNPSRMVRPTDL